MMGRRRGMDLMGRMGFPAFALVSHGSFRTGSGVYVHVVSSWSLLHVVFGLPLV